MSESPEDPNIAPFCQHGNACEPIGVLISDSKQDKEDSFENSLNTSAA